MRRLVPQRNLAAEVARRIAGEIAAGRVRPGDRLPTEAEMMAAMGVSRTVIREAVAALKADGLVVTRQGSGAFVAADPARPFRLADEGDTPMDDVVGVLELRLSVEVESAAMAAARATPRQLAAIRRACSAFKAAVDAGNSAVAEDFAFHRAIAEATGNRHFARFLEFLGQVIIPRQRVNAQETDEDGRRSYLEQIHGEHRAILKAIDARSAAGARGAMRAHLSNSLIRYRGLSSAPLEPQTSRGV